MSECIAIVLSRSSREGAIAQLVEQRTENPCVPSSILGGTTKNDLMRVVFWCPSTGIKLSKKKRIALSNNKNTQLVQPIDGQSDKQKRERITGRRNDGRHNKKSHEHMTTVALQVLGS